MMMGWDHRGNWIGWEIIEGSYDATFIAGSYKSEMSQLEWMMIMMMGKHPSV